MIGILKFDTNLNAFLEGLLNKIYADEIYADCFMPDAGFKTQGAEFGSQSLF